MPERLPSWLAALALAGCTVCGCATVRSSEGVVFRRVRPTIAFEILRDSEGLFILDVRPAAAYTGEIGHLNGARNIPLAELPQRLGELPIGEDETFIVYCDGGPCDQHAMSLLTAEGFEQAVLIDGGIASWRAAGFGTVHGAEPTPTESDEAP